MSKWEMVRLGDVLSDVITGEWGEESTDGQGTKVLRTTNFTNRGEIDFSNVVVRSIPLEKTEKKKLQPNDIILEKSGGSDNQPVGRVVYFDRKDDNYLCNNFTQILRANPNIAYSKYVFYLLFNLHRIGITESLQNKTTGIRNLQVRNYLSLKIPLPPLPAQKKIADVLDCVCMLIEKRKAQIEKLDLLVKSQFFEMFGDLDKYEKDTVDSVCTRIVGGGTPSKSKPEYYIGEIPWVTPKDMKSEFILDSMDHINEEAVKNSSVKVIPENSVLMVIRSGILKHTLPIAINVVPVTINQDMKAFIASDRITPEFLMYTFESRKSEILSNVRAVTADNIEFGIIRNLTICLPPLALQMRFADFMRQADKSKFEKQRESDTMDIFYYSFRRNA